MTFSRFIVVGPGLHGEYETEQAARVAIAGCREGAVYELKPDHDWQFYANGTFCRRCGAASDVRRPCR